MEKAKYRLQCDMEDLMVDNERANASSAAMDKKQKQFDRMIAEWKVKCENATSELEKSQKEARMFSADAFKLKTQYQDSQDSMEGLRRENKSLSDEIRDLVDQLSSGGRSVHELEKAVKRVEQEKAEIQVAFEEVERSFEREQAKVTFAQLEAANARQEVDKRVAEKDGEIENTKYVTI